MEELDSKTKYGRWQEAEQKGQRDTRRSGSTTKICRWEEREQNRKNRLIVTFVKSQIAQFKYEKHNVEYKGQPIVIGGKGDGRQESRTVQQNYLRLCNCTYLLKTIKILNRRIICGRTKRSRQETQIEQYQYGKYELKYKGQPGGCRCYRGADRSRRFGSELV